MDPKFRVSIRPDWRPELGEPLFLMFAKRHGMPLVRVLSQDAYNEKVELIQGSDKTPADKGDLLGRLATFSREVVLNDQGKLLVPKDLSEKAGIEADSEVTLVGRGIHFEIWGSSNFDKVLEIEISNQQDDDLGIF